VPSIALLAVFTTAVAAAFELFVEVVVFFDELELLDPPQAASAIAAAAPTATNTEVIRERRATPVPALAVPWCMPVLSLCLLM
jgi:hypothetical protein